MSKSILFLTPTLPYPPVSGGVIKSNKAVHYLSEHYDLSVACILKNEDAKHKDEFVSTLNIKELISEELNVPRTAKNFIVSNILGVPLNLYRNRSAAFKEKVEAAIHRFDVVFCDHYVMFQYIPDNYKGRVILHEHNCEYLIWQRYAIIEKSIAKKVALYNQSMRIRKYEQEICRKADVILAAPNDIDELVRIGADRNKFVETYHLGDDDLLKEPDLRFEDTGMALLYIGTLSWEANIDGLLWFFEEPWVRIKQSFPGIKLHIVGKNPDTRLKEAASKDPDIILEGFVEDLEPFFKKCRIFITPLRFGSGIKVKVINALYRGIPCVTTSIGAEGLKVKDSKHIFIRDQAAAHADAVNLLMTEKELWKSVSASARSIAREYYTWDKVLENIRIAVEG